MAVYKGWLIPDGFNHREWESGNDRFSDKYGPPKRPGVYVFIYYETVPDEENVEYGTRLNILYIGSTTNLNGRLRGHQLYYKLKRKYNPIKIYYQESERHFQYEKELIRKFTPKYNVIYNPLYNPQLEL